MDLNKRQREWLRQELKVTSQRCASVMKKMEPATREFVFASYKNLSNFQDEALDAAFKKYKLKQ